MKVAELQDADGRGQAGQRHAFLPHPEAVDVAEGEARHAAEQGERGPGQGRDGAHVLYPRASSTGQASDHLELNC